MAGREEQIIQERLRKLNELKKAGINPYAHKFEKKQSFSEIQKKYEKLKPDERAKESVKTAGRIMTIRDMGNLIFATLQDSSDKIQIVLQKEQTPEKTMSFFTKYIDSGDFIGFEGQVFKTKRGEVSVLVKTLELLTKSILPLPEKWHGLVDEEEKLRKRYLDLVMNPEVKKMFVQKSIFWNTMREFLLKKGFIEVETPVIESTPGGADAKPFVSHYNAYDSDVYLRISMGELWQKRLMVAGFEKTFEMGRQFRNEGVDAEHLQDYTQMEFYAAYWDFNQSMELVEEMYKELAKKTLGTLKFKYRDFEVDLGKKWEKIDYVKEIEKRLKINVLKADKKEMEKKLDSLHVKHEDNLEKGRLMDLLWKQCRKEIAGPAFLINHPVDVSPLAKRFEKDNRIVERFNVIMAGSELGNGYSELNDPIDQDERFKEQAKMKEKGDEEAQAHDKDFVEALKYGMPPTSGFGISERLFAVFMNKPVRECVLFPFMKPEESKEVSEEKSEKKKK